MSEFAFLFPFPFPFPFPSFLILPLPLLHNLPNTDVLIVLFIDFLNVSQYAYYVVTL